MKKISAISIMKGHNPHALEAVSAVSDIAEEIIIIDTGITVELKDKLLKKNKVKIITYKKQIQFAELVREDVKQYANNDYILFFDHDEVFTDGLKKIILDTFGKYDWYLIPRKNIIFGKWVNHARWWPDYQIRFLKKDAVYWASDIDIHKQPELKGNGLTVEATENNAIIHYNYENIDDFMTKAMHYARAEAQQLVDKKQRLSLANVFEKSISEFMSRFYLSDGFKDLTHGLVLSFFQMFYFFLVYFYYWEFYKYEDIEGTNLADKPRQFFKLGLINTDHWLITKKIVNRSKEFKIRIENKLVSFLK